MTLKTNYRNIAWNGLRKYQLIQNQDGTVSFLDVTEYTNVQDAKVLANDLNTNNDLVNRIMAGEFFYTEAESDALLALKQNVLSFDNAPTENSDNPVKSGGIKAALDLINARIDNLKVFAIHVCQSGEYDPDTLVPTIQNPDTETFYLVPSGTGSDVFTEWIYINNRWEIFGSSQIDMSNYVTVTDLQDALDDKQDVLTFDDAPTANSDNPVKSGGVKSALDGKSNTGHDHDDRYHTKQEMLALLNAKSDTGHDHDDRYYTETEVDALLNDKRNVSDSYTKTEVDTLLSAKSDNIHVHDNRYYTETEVDTLVDDLQDQIDAINNFAIHICSSSEYDPDTLIPTIQNPTENTFYLVPDGSGDDMYNEWIYINNAWEKFGGARIDLSQYYTKNQTDVLLAGKSDAGHGHSNYVQKSGDTMTGALNFSRNTGLVKFGLNANKNLYMQFSDSEKGSQYDNFYFPGYDNDSENNRVFYFLTSKTPVTIAQGGTGAKNAADARTALGAAALDHTHTYLLDNSANKITTIADDTTANWATVGDCVCFYGNADQLIDKPSNYGFLVNMCRGGDVNQLWFTQAGGKIYRRSGNSSGWNGTWLEMYSANSVIPISNGGTNATSATDALTNLGAAPSNHNHDGSYVNVSGDTMSGALNLANNTWNKIGDDAQMGDVNQGGCIGIQGLNADTGIKFVKKNGTAAGILRWNGSNFSVDKPIESSPGTGGSWIAGPKGTISALHVKKDSLNSNHYIPVVSIQTNTGGGWAIGNYNDDKLCFTFGTKANIDSNNNTVSNYYLDTNGNFSGSVSKVQDAGNSSKMIELQYSGSGVTSASWFAVWNDYKLMAISAANARTALGAAASSHNHSADNITSGTLPTARGGTGGDDSGWQTVPASGFTGTIFYRRIGAFMQIVSSGAKLSTALSSSAGVVIGTLPSGYRPSKEMYVTVSSPNTAGAEAALLMIQTNGNLKFFKPASLSSWGTGLTMYFSTMFML